MEDKKKQIEFMILKIERVRTCGLFSIKIRSQLNTGLSRILQVKMSCAKQVRVSGLGNTINKETN